MGRGYLCVVRLGLLLNSLLCIRFDLGALFVREDLADVT